MPDKNSPLDLWQEKLTFLREEEAKAVGDLKFSIRKSIEEAEQKIRALGGAVPEPHRVEPHQEKPATTTGPEGRSYVRQAAAIVTMAIGAAVLYYGLGRDPMTGLADDFRRMELTPNVGFSSHYMPGTVIQLRQDDGELARPKLLLWPDECFPGQEPRPSPFTLPSQSGTKATKLRLDASQLASFLPSLGIDGAKSWDVVFQEPRILSFALGDVSQKFSQACLAKLEAFLEGGIHQSWMATISESVVASGMTLTIEWQADADTAAAARVSEEVKKNLADDSVDVRSTGRTVYEVEGRIVLAYRTFAMDFLGSPPSSR